ncbi:pseudouridine synthase [Thermoactinomyces sp. CICC 10522]|uniref:pseudouridine synthase n=1 Tax=Thermoactinomyces sp. CICC 10522 TaxID=2767427 RepID=UPI0018DD0B3E|nr:pseudouridine synthase [Thermoactinomyces sp. CICC 10522]MBH8603324.1 rRNA pseudouridine synthase [Thermoactinomyces sp. CICC 10522]
MGTQKSQRLDKILAHMGIGTRKEIKKLVRAGRVRLNGITANDPGIHVYPDQDELTVDGIPILYREHIYLMMNKPQGVISATEDRFNEVISDLLEPEHRVFDPFPVGRLDKDTEGLILLTNDGKLSHQLLSPKKHVPKVYYALVEGAVTEADREAFASGITLDDGYETLPGQLRILNSGPVSEVEVTIYEGKYHQVKRMFEAVGKRVKFLKRIAMGPLSLDPDLEPGEYRELSDEEIEMLKKATSSR